MKIRKKIISLTMFDLLKGIGILMVVFRHSVHTELAEVEQSVFWRLAYSVLMPLFFITSGYWLKKRSLKDGIVFSAKSLLKPYLIVMFLINVVGFVHRMAIHNLDEWRTLFLKQSLLVISGNYSRIGAMWFVFALMVGWMIFYGLIQIENKRTRGLVSIGICWVGTMVLSYKLPFQIAQGMIAQLFIYVGYIMKKEKLLEKKIPVIWGSVLALIWLIIGYLSSREAICDLATYRFGNGMPAVLSSLCGAFLIIKAGVQLSRVENRFIEKLGTIGRYTMWILCIHSFEGAVVPWKYLFRLVGEESLAGSLFQLILRGCFISCGCICLKKFLGGIKNVRKNY